MRPHSSADTSSLPSSFWIAGFLSVGLAIAGGLWHVTRPAPTSSPISFSALQVDADRLEQIQADRKTAVGDIFDDPRVRDFVETVRHVNHAQFTTDNAPRQRNAQLERRIRAHASEVIPVTDWRGFLAVGSPVFDACREGLERVMNAVDSGDLSSDAAMNGDVPDTYETYRQNCGNLYPVLVRRRLLSEGGSWRSPDAPALFELSQRYRWASSIERMYSPWRQLDPYERQVFLRWRIETPEAFDLETRRRSIELAEGYLDDYPAAFARGVIAWQQGDRQAALRHLREAREANPNSERIAYAFRWARDSVAASDRTQQARQ